MQCLNKGVHLGGDSRRQEGGEGKHEGPMDALKIRYRHRGLNFARNSRLREPLAQKTQTEKDAVVNAVKAPHPNPIARLSAHTTLSCGHWPFSREQPSVYGSH